MQEMPDRQNANPLVGSPAVPRTAVAILTARAGEANVGGVATWASRLAAQLRERVPSASSWRLCTVVMPVDSGAGLPPALREEPDAQLISWPESGDVLELLDLTRRQVLELAPDVLLPANSDVCQMVAQQIRDEAMGTERPVRVISAARTDEPSNRVLIERYQPTDGGVGVSAVCADWLRDILRAHCTDRYLPVSMIPSGAPVAEAPKTPASGGPIRIVWLGRLEQPQKRVMDLVPLAAALRRRNVEFELHIAGDGDMRVPLTSALSQAHLLADQHGPVHLLGALGAAEVQSLLGCCDIFTLTSAAEGTSVAMQEAMGLGLAPVVTRIPGIERWITHNRSGLLAEIGDTDTLAEHIALLALRRDALTRIGSEAWKVASEHFSAAATARKYAALFDNVMALPVPVQRSHMLGLRRLHSAAGSASDLHATAHWPRCTFAPDQAGHAMEICKLWAAEAGVEIASSPLTALPGKAVIFDPGQLPPTPAVVSGMLRRGSIPIVPHALLNTRPADRARAVLHRLAEEGFRRIALYGAGNHSRMLCEVLALGPVNPFGIVGFIDDAAAANHGERCVLAGLPIVAPGRACDDLAPDAIVLSSDRFEPELLAAARHSIPGRIPILPIYDMSLVEASGSHEAALAGS